MTSAAEADGRFQSRNEPEHTRLQHEAGYENPRHQQLDEGVVDLKGLALLPPGTIAALLEPPTP
jgi:hypothetical protein